MDTEAIAKYVQRLGPWIDELGFMADIAEDELHNLVGLSAHEKCLEGERDE